MRIRLLLHEIQQHLARSNMKLYLSVKSTVLVAGSSDTSLSMFEDLLRQDFTVTTVREGYQVLPVVRDVQPELILLYKNKRIGDIDGDEMCCQLKADPWTHDIPVIFLADKSDGEDVEQAMALGAVDYMNWSINPKIFLARIRAHLVNAAYIKALLVDKNYLEFEVEKQTKEFENLQQTTILALAALAEVRDQETGNHLLRTQNYIRTLANNLNTHPRFSAFLTPKVIDILFKCAPLHDIGKVGIPDRILLKKGRYEPHEFELMKSHPRLGYEALVNAQGSGAASLDFIEIGKQIVYCHHEKWDGSGYPQGLAGDSIPIPARLMALADVYDALISKRVYKDGMSHEEAASIILQGRGLHFDPDVVDAFLDLGDEFQNIAKRYADSDDELEAKELFLNQVMG